ncbi:hypothetical protein JY409_03275 [Stenotrophomonas maltophilia]|nr:hypothetical protein [Stenotrophomonas maltophilia]
MDETVYDAAWRAYRAAPRAVANGPSRSAVRAAVNAAIAAHHRAEEAARQPVDGDDLSCAYLAGRFDARLPVGSFPEWFELVIRDICELDPEDPDAADTVCIRLLDLRLIMERHALPAQAVDLGTGVKAIAAERERQLQAEGFTRKGDRQYRRGELASAATAYAQVAAMDLYCGTRGYIAGLPPPSIWPWAPEWWKPVDTRRDLVRAGALIAAQIDLIDSLVGVTDAP